MRTEPISALPRGTSFVRAACALAATKNVYDAAVFAERWRDSPDAVGYLKSAIAAGTSTDAAWASALAPTVYASAEFDALLKQGALIGKIAGLRKVPFLMQAARATSGTSAAWVAEGAGNPVTKMSLVSDVLGLAKCGATVVVSQELARFGAPSAVDLIKTDLLRAGDEFLDREFIDPAIAPVTNVSPGAVTYGATTIQSGGSTAALLAADFATMVGAMADANETDSLQWIMTRGDAAKLALKRDAQGGPAFGQINVNGGFLGGIPVVVSNSVPHSVSSGTIIVLLNGSAVTYADSPNLLLDVSSEASIEMSDAPTNDSATPALTTMVSLFQTNSVAIRMTRWNNWKLARSTGVQVLDNVHI